MCSAPSCGGAVDGWPTGAAEDEAPEDEAAAAAAAGSSEEADVAEDLAVEPDDDDPAFDFGTFRMKSSVQAPEQHTTNRFGYS